MKTIILADNQDITKAGCKYLLNNIFASQYAISEVVGKKDLMTCLAQNPESLVVLDYTVFDFESVNELYNVSSRFANTSWLLFSDDLSEDFLRYLLFSSDAFSIVMKDNSIEEITTAFRETVKGYRYICNRVSNLLLQQPRNNSELIAKQHLTSTEKEILKEIALGKTTKEIAGIRFVSIHTIMMLNV